MRVLIFPYIRFFFLIHFKQVIFVVIFTPLVHPTLLLKFSSLMRSWLLSCFQLGVWMNPGSICNANSTTVWCAVYSHLAGFSGAIKLLLTHNKMDCCIALYYDAEKSISQQHLRAMLTVGHQLTEAA